MSRRDFQRDKISALGELSLAMAHEIRNPIGVINTACKLMEKTEDPDKRAELHRMIREECQRLDQFLNDFQQLARHRKPQLTLIDPALPLEKALQVMLAGRDQVTVTRAFEHGDLYICADANCCGRPGSIWSATPWRRWTAVRELQVGSELDGHGVMIYLQDSGPGISLELMTRLFEPFFTTKEQGSGLGLTMASTLAEASGAYLELVPESGPAPVSPCALPSPGRSDAAYDTGRR